MPVAARADTEARQEGDGALGMGLRPWLELRVLGGVSLGWEGGPTWSPMRRECRRLLTHLALQYDRPLDRRALAFRLWPDVLEEVALNRLRRALSALRAELAEHGQDGPMLLQAGHQTIGLRRHPRLWVDAVVFEHACEDLPLLADAELGVLRQFEPLVLLGCGLIDEGLLAEDDWLRTQTQLLRERCRYALVLLRDRLAAGGDLEAATRVAARLVDLDPLAESATGELMRLHWLLGRRDEAMAAYARCAAVIAAEQNCPPADWLQALRAAIDRGATPREVDRLLPRARSVLVGAGGRLPRPISRFFGREEQLGWLREALRDERLVTILGPGGIGKTRLAIEAARLHGDDFRDGVIFLPLDEITIDEGVAVFLVQELGHSDPLKGNPIDEAVRIIGQRHLLIVVDNCEHVMAGAEGLVTGILGGCAHVAILATSRTALDIPERRDLRLGSLDYPPVDGGVATEELSRAAAVALFVDRMDCLGFRKVQGPDDLRTIARVCKRLEGIPLAIELAAARTTIMTLRGIERSIDEHLFALLEGPPTDAPERHHAMWTTIAWSYQLLGEEDQRLLRWLAVFPHDAGEEGVRRVGEMLVAGERSPAAGAAPDWQAGLRRLVGCSLIQAQPAPGDLDQATAQEDATSLPALLEDVIPLALDLIAQVFPSEGSSGSNADEWNEGREASQPAEGPEDVGNGARSEASVTVEEPDGQARYTMYSVVREFARRHLRASEDHAPARRACCAYYTDLATRAGEGYAGSEQERWHAILQSEGRNIAEVMRWLEADEDWEACLTVALGLTMYWYQTARYGMELEWVGRLLQRLQLQTEDKVYPYTKLRHRYAVMLYGAGRNQQAIDLAETCLREERYAADPDTKARILLHLAYFQQGMGRLDDAEQYCRQLLDQPLAIDVEVNAMGLLAFLTHRTVGAGKAAEMFEQALAKARRHGKKLSGELDLHDGLGYALCSMGRYREATEHFVRAIKGAADVGAVHVVVTSLLGVALSCHRVVLGSGYGVAVRTFQAVKATSSPILVDLACYQVGASLVETKEFQRALLFLEKSRQQNRDANDGPGEMYAICSLVEASVELGQADEVQALLDQVGNKPRHFWSNKDLSARYKRARAILLMRQGKHIEAAALAEDAVTEFSIQQSVFDELVARVLAGHLDTNDSATH